METKEEQTINDVEDINKYGQENSPQSTYKDSDSFPRTIKKIFVKIDTNSIFPVRMKDVTESKLVKLLRVVFKINAKEVVLINKEDTIIPSELNENLDTQLLEGKTYEIFFTREEEPKERAEEQVETVERTEALVGDSAAEEEKEFYTRKVETPHLVIKEIEDINEKGKDELPKLETKIVREILESSSTSTERDSLNSEENNSGGFDKEGEANNEKKLMLKKKNKKKKRSRSLVESDLQLHSSPTKEELHVRSARKMKGETFKKISIENAFVAWQSEERTANEVWENSNKHNKSSILPKVLGRSSATTMNSNRRNKRSAGNYFNYTETLKIKANTAEKKDVLVLFESAENPSSPTGSGASSPKGKPNLLSKISGKLIGKKLKKENEDPFDVERKYDSVPLNPVFTSTEDHRICARASKKGKFFSIFDFQKKELCCFLKQSWLPLKDNCLSTRTT